MLEHERWDRVYSVTCIGVPWQLRPDQRNLARPGVPEAEADQGVAPSIVMPAAKEIRHEERSHEVWVHRRVSSMHAVGVRHAQCEGSS